MSVFGVSAAHALTVVSLGDSYASGEGTSPYLADTDRKDNGHKCHRSARAWPRLVNAAQETHLACSGAVINNILKTGQTRRGRDSVAQLQQLRTIRASRPIDYATVMIGGNDLGFADKLKQCYLNGNVRGCLKNRDVLRNDLARLRPRLAGAYRDVNMATQGGYTVVVGYPDIFPPPHRGDRCAWLTKAMKENIEWFSGRLESTLKAAARDARVSYVSTRNAFDYHELCTGTSWVRALGGKPGDITGDQQQGHPLKEGQTAIALKVLAWMRKNPRPGASVPDAPVPPNAGGDEQASPPVPPASRTIVVDNRVTNGGTQMREDTPAYLSTVTRNFCKRDGCALGGTDMGSGAVISAECTTLGDRTTNGQDNSTIDDGNPGLYSSTRWYGIRWGDGRFGYISEVWIRGDYRGGLGLRGC